VQFYFGLAWAANNPKQSSFAYARFATSLEATSAMFASRISPTGDNGAPTWRFVNRNDTPELTDKLLSNGWCSFFRRYGRDFRHIALPLWDVVPGKKTLRLFWKWIKKKLLVRTVWRQFGKFSASGPLLRCTEFRLRTYVLRHAIICHNFSRRQILTLT